MSHRQRNIRHRRGGRSKLLLALLVLVLTAGIGLLSVIGYVLVVAATAPALDELKPIDKGATSVIFAADGSRLGYVRSDEIRDPVGWNELPHHMRNAAVAIEDERFYSHEGIDYGAIVRAGVRNIQSGKNVQGGSTITQQLVRALYIKDPGRSYERKIREAKLASELEKEKSKRWILHSYLNSVPFGTVGGRTAVGTEAAAQIFFSKSAKSLRLHESALLAGLPQAPSQYNPFRNPSAALGRRNEVLRVMVKNRFITAAQAEEASQKRLGVRRGRRYTTRREPYFFDYVEEKLIEEYGVGVYRRGGLRIHTTINPKLQEAARKAITGQLSLPSDPSSAIVSIDPKTGYIKAMASSGTYNDRSFNLAAQGHRQPGSAFKTMVLTAAIRKGYSPTSTTYSSRPLNLNVPGYGPWKVQTYDQSYGGSMNLVRGTLKSDNTIYAQLIIDVGPKTVRETARLLGITTKLDGLPAEGLGGLRLGVSPLEMSNAYATLASGGIRNEPKAIRKVEFDDGKSDDLGKPKRKRVISDGIALEVTKILKQNVQSGTGTKASIDCPSAGKTGTTDNFNDAWFVGYTPKLASSVWVGYPNALKEMRSVHGTSVAGGTFPASIWHDYMVVASAGSCEQFPTTAKDPFNSSASAADGGSQSRYGTSGEGSDGDRSYSSPSPGATGGNSAGGGYRGYDPRVYEAPPQAAPAPVPLRPPPPNSVPSPVPRNGGGIDGNGVGGGGGLNGGGSPPD
ncbi:MAG: transglycosylase domain-containing protein [Actinomycetota bacterium]|nr:transglycosylase domain-containing protein [Actinomycetota bacterium]